jgi:pilus assembly protein CpaE
MQEKIRVLLADDIAATRASVGKLIAFHDEMTVIGEAENAEQVIALAKKLLPDIILMDINMPGMDGITATQILSTEVPTASIIMMSVQNEQEYLRKAMVAGAKNYLTKPFSSDELLQAIKQVHESELRRRVVFMKPESTNSKQGKVITVFSTKGGIGKTTIATNLAVALAAKTDGNVCVVDADLQFGDVALFLNVLPQATIADLVQDIDHLDEKLLKGYLCPFSDSVKVLPAPLRPEQAETISGVHLTAILKTLRSMFQYVVVDTAPSFNDAMLAALDAADEVLIISAMDLPTVKNVKLCLEIMESLNYTEGKVKLVLNRADSEGGMDIREVEETLRRGFSATVPSDGKTVVSSVNRGVPFVISNPDTNVAQSVYKLARMVSCGEWKEEEKPKSVVTKIKSLFG